MGPCLIGRRLPLDSGVPQGSVLGPLLFLLYINDIGQSIKSEIRLFADDCILYREIIYDKDISILQKDIDSMHNWSVKWQMNFNANKCHILFMSRKNNKITNTYNLGD